MRSNDYLREDCISHVILEFESAGRPSCAGIMVESFKEGECREHPWVLTDTTLDEVYVYDEERFLDPRRMIGKVISQRNRETAAQGRLRPRTQRQSRFGR
jgi:hypothetical protein